MSRQPAHPDLFETQAPPLAPEQRDLLRPLVHALARIAAAEDHARETKERKPCER